MGAICDLFGEKLHIINIGIENFKEDLQLQQADVTHVQWAPPAVSDAALLQAVDELLGNETVAAANEKATQIIMSAQPVLVDIGRAVDMIPGMTNDTILHAGPPITWEEMCGPMQGAIAGALIYEGRAKTQEEAKAIAASGSIRFLPCHELGAVGPMAGIVSPSMPVHVVVNKTFGNRAYATVNEGLGKVLRFGAFSESVIERLKWIEEGFMPVLKEAIRLYGELDLKVITAQAVQMGDECHNRNKAATSLFFREMIPSLMQSGFPNEQIARAIEFIRGNDHYFLNLSMAACKSSLDPANGVENATVVTTMARNGVTFGIKVSGLGNQWFTAPANYIQGLLFPGFSPEDANPDIGDSAITETMGIGGFAMGASPAITQFVGGTVADAVNYSKSMYMITTRENRSFSLPPLDFKGTATGIDIVKVLDSGILPVINTGIAHRVAGIGQIGAGIVNPPMECFEKAMRAYAQKYMR